MIKIFKNIIHKKKINHSFFPNKSSYNLHFNKYIKKNNNNKNIIINTDKLIFNKPYFENESTDAYKIIYKSFINNEDFLNYSYTTFSLSIALNNIRNNKDIRKLDKNINIHNVEIIDDWFEYGIINTNNSIFGINNKNHLINELIIGMIGPEFKILWDKKPIKQKVLIKYYSENYVDILEWERYVSFKNQNWYVSNINYII